MITQHAFRSIEWKNDQLRLLDQRKLPAETTYLDYSDYRAVAEAITVMVVRGAPAIGITAAFGLAIAARQSSASTAEAFLADLHRAGDHLNAARPTAVNLSWAVAHLLNQADLQAKSGQTIESIQAALLTEAKALCEADIKICQQLGTHAQELIPNPATRITPMAVP